MRRRLQCVDQQLPGSRALHALKRICVDNNDGVTTMQRDKLRPIAVRQSHKFAESRLGVLKAPTTARRLRSGVCNGWYFSSHADQISMVAQSRKGMVLSNEPDL